MLINDNENSMKKTSQQIIYHIVSRSQISCSKQCRLQTIHNLLPKNSCQSWIIPDNDRPIMNKVARIPASKQELAMTVADKLEDGVG